MKNETFFGRFSLTFPPWIGPLSIFLFFLANPSLSLSQPLNFQEAGEINPSEFLAVSSDQEAISVFRKTFGKTLSFNPPQAINKGEKAKLPHISQELTDEISQFMGHVIIVIRANRLSTLIQDVGRPSLSQLSNRETPQSLWLISQSRSHELTQLMDLAAAIFQLSQEMTSQNNPAPPQFSAFAHHFDQTYPHMVDGPHSWISILEKKGLDAINHRFSDFWEKQSTNFSSSESTLDIPPEHQKAYDYYYSKTRLLPVFVSHLIGQSIQLEAKATYDAGESWNRLRKWNESHHKLRALTRLCGKWHWTVHNHQNHQDHKMTLSFSPSSQPISGQPHPDVIIMNGDTVYLKWTFPSGYQEDSLLLSNRDQRLEGTFKNSMGLHGNISGKRLSNCNP